MLRKSFQVLMYVLYGLVAFIAFVYIMLPYDLLRDRLIEQVSQGDIDLNIAQLGPSFPPGLAMRNVQVAVRQSNAFSEVLRLQTLHARPQWSSLFSPAKSLAFTGQLYDGRIFGNVRYTARDGAPDWESLATFEDLDVSRYPLFQEMQANEQFTVTGRLSGTARTRLTATGQLAQSDIDFEMEPAILTLGQASPLYRQSAPDGPPQHNELPCDELNGAALLNPRNWQIKALTCQGDDIMIKLRGTFRPRQPWLASVPNLRVEMRSETTYQAELDLISQLALRRPLGNNGVLKFGLGGRLSNIRAVR